MSGVPFDPRTSAVYLEDGGFGAELPLSESFWADLMEGRIDVDSGWLVLLLPMAHDMDHWERHPEGEELLLRQSGRFVVIMETPDGDRRLRLDETTPAVVVPRGTWHRFEVEEAGEILFATYGRGTEHREV